MITVIRPLSAGNMIISLSFCRSFIAFCGFFVEFEGSFNMEVGCYLVADMLFGLIRYFSAFKCRF